MGAGGKSAFPRCSCNKSGLQDVGSGCLWGRAPLGGLQEGKSASGLQRNI